MQIITYINYTFISKKCQYVFVKIYMYGLSCITLAQEAAANKEEARLIQGKTSRF